MIVFIDDAYPYSLFLFNLFFHVHLKKELAQSLLLEEMLLEDIHDGKLLRFCTLLLSVVLYHS